MCHRSKPDKHSIQNTAWVTAVLLYSSNSLFIWSMDACKWQQWKLHTSVFAGCCCYRQYCGKERRFSYLDLWSSSIQGFHNHMNSKLWRLPGLKTQVEISINKSKSPPHWGMKAKIQQSPQDGVIFQNPASRPADTYLPQSHQKKTLALTHFLWSLNIDRWWQTQMLVHNVSVLLPLNATSPVKQSSAEEGHLEEAVAGVFPWYPTSHGSRT